MLPLELINQTIWFLLNKITLWFQLSQNEFWSLQSAIIFLTSCIHVFLTQVLLEPHRIQTNAFKKEYDPKKQGIKTYLCC